MASPSSPGSRAFLARMGLLGAVIGAGRLLPPRRWRNPGTGDGLA